MEGDVVLVDAAALAAVQVQVILEVRDAAVQDVEVEAATARFEQTFGPIGRIRPIGPIRKVRRQPARVPGRTL